MTCSEVQCAKPAFARGWCSAHYASWRRRQPGRCVYCGGDLAARPAANGRTHDRCLEKRRVLWHTYMAEVIDGYGGRCACCGETERKFLTIDHVNGDGNQDRKSLGGGNRRLLLKIIKAEFPPEYQCLCFNCNCGRQRNGGICPHTALYVVGNSPAPGD